MGAQAQWSRARATTHECSTADLLKPIVAAYVHFHIRGSSPTAPFLWNCPFPVRGSPPPPAHLLQGINTAAVLQRVKARPGLCVCGARCSCNANAATVTAATATATTATAITATAATAAAGPDRHRRPHQCGGQLGDQCTTGQQPRRLVAWVWVQARVRVYVRTR